MDISSVRIRPVPVKAQAVITLTYGHPRLNWPAMAKVNNRTYRGGGFEPPKKNLDTALTIILKESLIHPGKIREDLLTVWNE